MSVNMSPDQDAYHQYIDGRELLHISLMEREKRLRELAELTNIPKGIETEDTIIGFDQMRAQTVLFELSLLTERIESLVMLINEYANQCGEPPIEITSNKSWASK